MRANFFFFLYRIYYEYGIGVYPDIGQAKEWYSRSASKGYGPAQNKLKSISTPKNQQLPLQKQYQNMIKTDKGY